MITPQHPFFPKFRAIMESAARHAPVYDLGTSGRFAKELSFVRDLFDESTYFAGGFSANPDEIPPGCDFACDVQHLEGLADGCAGAVLSMQVIEHVEDPVAVAREMWRVVRPGGMAVVATPFMNSYHGRRPAPRNPLVDTANPAPRGGNSHGSYGDFWRYTHEGLAHLLANAGFARVDVWPIDGPLVCRLEMLKLFRPLLIAPRLGRIIGRLDPPRLGKATTGHIAVAIKGLEVHKQALK